MAERRHGPPRCDAGWFHRLSGVNGEAQGNDYPTMGCDETPTRLRFIATAAQAFVILLALPIGYRRRSLPDLLRRLESSRFPCPLSPAQIARIVRRVAIMRVFRTRVFPRACLRRALTSFAILSGRCPSSTFVIGVQVTPDGIGAHSWVTVDGQPVDERRSVDDFRIVYTYPGQSPPASTSSDVDAQLLEAIKEFEK